MTRRASLPPSPLSAPLEEMKIRWDGHRPAKGRPAHAWVKYLASGGTVDDDGVLFAQYAHLTTVVVKNNQKIARGQFLGTTGVTGNADQKYPHLHFEIRKVRWPGTGKDGLSNRIDPDSIFRVDFIEPFDVLDKLSRTA